MVSYRPSTGRENCRRAGHIAFAVQNMGEQSAECNFVVIDKNHKCAIRLSYMNLHYAPSGYANVCTIAQPPHA